MNGVGAFIAYKKLNFGVLCCVDKLLDQNAGIWICDGKPYLGFGIGLNLN